MRKSVVGTRASLGEMQAALRLLKGGGDLTAESQKKLKAQIAAQRATLASSSQAFLEAGGKVGDLTKKQTSFADMLKATHPRVGALVGKLQGIPPSALLAAGAIGAATAATLLLVGALAKATIGLAGYAIGQADVRRSEMLRLQGLTQLRNFWTGFAGPVGNGAATAASLQAAIDDVSGTVNLSRDAVGGYAESLYKMGLRGENLRLTLQGMATTSAVLGETQAQAFAGMAAGANMTGQSVRALADDVKARLGGIAKAQTLSLSTQFAKLHENVSALFRDLKIDRLLEAVSGVTRLLSPTSAAGAATRRLVNAGLQPMINLFTAGLPIARDFFLGVATGGLRVVGVLLDVGIWLKKQARELGLFKDKSVDAFGWGTKAAKAFAIGIGIASAPLALVVVAVGLLGAMAYGAYKLVSDIPWAKLGRAIPEGIVNGIKSGASWVVDTIRGMGASAWKAFKGALGIASPSKVFAQLGVQLPRGLVAGIKLGAPEVEAAAATIIRPEAFAMPAAPAMAAPTAAKSSTSTATITFGDIHVHGDGTKEQAQDLMAQVAALLGGAGISLGVSHGI